MIEVPRLSASSVKSFEQCPGQFRFDKLTDIEGADSENKYTITGSAVHEAIEDTLRETADVETLGENELAHLFKSQFHADPRSDELEQKMINRAMKSLQTAARYLGSMNEYSITGIEEEFFVDIEDVTFKGYIDMTTEYSVIDWKTGRVPDGDDMGEKIQGMVYWDGFKELFGKEPETIRFVYLKEETERVYDEKGSDYGDMVHKVRDIKRAVRDDDFPYNPGDACYWCSFETACPASKVGAGGIRWEVF